MKQDGDIVLRARGLSVGYASKGRVARMIARDLDLQLKRGEFVCLLGPNGAGKSTLIRALAGIDQPLAGTIRLDGQDLVEMKPKYRARRVSVVLTESLPMGAITGRAIAALGRHPHTNWTGMLTKKDRDRIDWALEAVGAVALAERQVSELSDGERQKIMLARVLAQEAAIMLLDEPTAYLDLPRRVELMQTLRDLTRREGLAILLSTHDLDLALRCADKLWLLGEDAGVRVGVPEDLALDGSLASTFTSGSLDWDDENGSFRMHREPRNVVYVEGEGAAATWTARALARIGYGAAASPEGVALRLRCDSSESGRTWVLSDGRSEPRVFNRLSDLLDDLRKGN